MPSLRSDSSNVRRGSARREPRQERSRFLVDATLEATERALSEKGFASTSIRSIARLAGISVGSLYQYFDNKTSLVGTLIERRFESDMRQVRQWLDAGVQQPLEDSVKTGAALLIPLEEWKKDAFVAMVDSMGEAGQDSNLRRVLDELVELMTEFLERHPETRVERPQALARSLVFGLRASAIEAMRAEDPWRPELLREELCRMALGIVRSAQPMRSA